MSWIEQNPKKKVIKAIPSTRMVLIKQSLVGIALALMVALLGYSIWHFTRMDTLTLKEVSVVGGETVSHEQIIYRAEQVLQGSYFHFIPKRFSWTYPESEVLKAVYTIDRIKNVHLEVEDGEKLIIAFEEYRPFALWCKELISKNCLFLDSSGYSFAEAPMLDGGAFLRYSEVNREPVLKVEAFSGAFIKDTNLFVASAYETLGLNIIQVERQGEDDVIYHVAGGGIIKASNRMQSGETLENLAAILNSKEFEHIEPGNFKYIDLRFGNKVFVNEAMEETVVATSTEATTLIEAET